MCKWAEKGCTNYYSSSVCIRFRVLQNLSIAHAEMKKKMHFLHIFVCCPCTHHKEPGCRVKPLSYTNKCFHCSLFSPFHLSRVRRVQRLHLLAPSRLRGRPGVRQPPWVSVGQGRSGTCWSLDVWRAAETAASERGASRVRDGYQGAVMSQDPASLSRYELSNNWGWRSL